MKEVLIKIGDEIFEVCISSNNLPIFDEDNCGQISVGRLTAAGISHTHYTHYYTVKEIERGKSLLSNPGSRFNSELHNNLESYRAALIKFNRLKIFM